MYQWMNLIMIIGWCLTMMGNVGAESTSTAARDLYVNPAHIRAIAFPTHRIATHDGSQVPESLHVVCEPVVFHSLHDAFVYGSTSVVITTQPLTYVNETRVACYASDPTLVVHDAVVECAYVPSRDERVVIDETIERDSCRVRLSLVPYAPPTPAHPTWLPRAESNPSSPYAELYAERMARFGDQWRDRQIATRECGKATYPKKDYTNASTFLKNPVRDICTWGACVCFIVLLVMVVVIVISFALPAVAPIVHTLAFWALYGFVAFIVVGCIAHAKAMP